MRGVGVDEEEGGGNDNSGGVSSVDDADDGVDVDVDDDVDDDTPPVAAPPSTLLPCTRPLNDSCNEGIPPPPPPPPQLLDDANDDDDDNIGVALGSIAFVSANRWSLSVKAMEMAPPIL